MMGVFLKVFLAMVLDFIFGEPEKIWTRYPHPATLMGRAVDYLDTALNRGAALRTRGFIAVAALVILALIPGLVLEGLNTILASGSYAQLIVDVLEIIIAAVLISHKSLVEHVRNVATALQNGLPQGRNAVSMIVGRDTGVMDEPAIVRATIESAAENFSDGVVAPVFWFVILGLPGILLYKIINTADSMIGYQNEKYAAFGYAAAKFDDALNWVPARLTALLICAAHLNFRALNVARADANLHRSVNAGWPEAAMAGVLDVALSGPRSYDGQMSDDSFVNNQGSHNLTAHNILDAVSVLNRSWYVLIGFIALSGGIYALL